MKRNLVSTLFGLLPVIIAWVSIPAFLPLAGCSPGIISVLTTPTSDEMTVPPEYDITKEKGKKILTIVEQPYFLRAHPNLRYFVTVGVNKILEDRANIKKELLISYDALADLRSGSPDFSNMTPSEIGSKLGADYVLVITITKYQLDDKSEPGYFTGRFDAQAQLFSVSPPEKLWPSMETARTVRVGFDSVRSGADTAALRLAGDAAHCITRYLYNCQKNKFKSSDEETEMGFGQ
jgi:hypothetical protein